MMDDALIIVSLGPKKRSRKSIANHWEHTTLETTMCPDGMSRSLKTCTVQVSVPPVNMTSKTRKREIDGLAPTSLFSQHISFRWNLSHLENFVGPTRRVRISDLSRLLDDANSFPYFLLLLCVSFVPASEC